MFTFIQKQNIFLPNQIISLHEESKLAGNAGDAKTKGAFAASSGLESSRGPNR